jgi:hypothetical protein
MSLVTYRRGFVMVGVVVKAVVVKHSKAKVVKQERRKRLKERAAMATTILLSIKVLSLINLWLLGFLVFDSYIERIITYIHRRTANLTFFSRKKNNNTWTYFQRTKTPRFNTILYWPVFFVVGTYNESFKLKRIPLLLYWYTKFYLPISVIIGQNTNNDDGKIH